MIDFLDYSAQAVAANRVWSYNLLLFICVIYMYLGRLEILPVFYAASSIIHSARGAAHSKGGITYAD